MNTELFLAKRLVRSNKGKFSFTFVVIAITSIALGLAIMFVAVSILTAFKKEITEKVTGFHGHIQIGRFSVTGQSEPPPIDRRQPFYRIIKSNREIDHIQGVATKTGIVKTDNHIQGVVLKGVDQDYRWDFFKERMVAGVIPDYHKTNRSDSVIISSKLASMLELKLHDPVRMFFISDENILGRRFIISGLYETGLEEFDKMYILGDIRHIQKLNNWQPNEVGGFEVFINDFRDLDRLGVWVYHQIGFDLDASTVTMNHQQIFDWLELQDVNVLIILILIILVSATTIVSTLLILVLERTSMIGILAALGMKNSGIRKLFIFNGLYITLWGMVWGNLSGFTICWIQLKYGIVKLSEESYYMSKIPVDFDLFNILLINAGTLLLSTLIFLLPSFVISRVSPVKAIRMN